MTLLNTCKPGLYVYIPYLVLTIGLPHVRNELEVRLRTHPLAQHNEGQSWDWNWVSYSRDTSLCALLPLGPPVQGLCSRPPGEGPWVLQDNSHGKCGGSSSYRSVSKVTCDPREVSKGKCWDKVTWTVSTGPGMQGG